MLASLISDKTKAKKSHENRKKTAGVDEVDDVGGCERTMRIAQWMRRERNHRERRDDELK